MIRPKILIVDDDPRMLYVLEQALSTSDYDIHKASSGIYALNKLKKEDFALVILDIKMSVMDGLTTARLIRNETSNNEIPIIFISGMNEKDLVSTGYAMGAIDFILKPVDYHVLKSKVRFFADLYCRTEALRRAEEQLRRVRSELERALARQNELLQCLEHRKQLFVRMNDNALSQIWITGTEGLKDLSFTDIHPDDVDRCVTAYREAVQHLHPFRLEYRIRKGDGTYRSILDIGSPRKSTEGVFMGYIGAAVDITDSHSRVPYQPFEATTQ